MNYELAKELKVMGFPQSPWIQGRYYYLGDGTKILFDKIENGKDENGMTISYLERLTRIPILSELIEACGDKFGSLDKKYGKWRTFQFVEEPLQGFTNKQYNSPEEAVANLWLSLNKK